MSDERLQKILAECGIASRRRAEELIAAGKVKVNGRRAQVGDKADLKRDTVTVEGKRLSAPEKKLYLMLNKPRGFVTTLRDEQGRKCVADLVTGAGARVFPVGRLDRDSEGLLLLTNDGEFANALTHPSSHVPKVYRVTIRQDVTEEQAAVFVPVCCSTGARRPRRSSIFCSRSRPVQWRKWFFTKDATARSGGCANLWGWRSSAYGGPPSAGFAWGCCNRENGGPWNRRRSSS